MNAVITGASKGLGKELAYFLAAKGFNLHLIARSRDLLDNLKSELEAGFKITVTCHTCDFSNSASTSALGNLLRSELSSIDLLVNNVGAFEFGTLEFSSVEQLQKLLQINVSAAYSITTALIPLFKQQQKGHIFNIGSIVTQTPRKDVAAYTISKYALHGFTKVLCDEMKDDKVKVTELVPGSINTSSWDGVDDVPKKDFIQPQELIDSIWMCYNNTSASNIEQITIRPLNRDF